MTVPTTNAALADRYDSVPEFAYQRDAALAFIDRALAQLARLGVLER